MSEELRREFDALTRLEALEESAARGELASHRRRLLTLAARFPSGTRGIVALEGLGAALQMDLPFLRAYPEALISTLLWRCSHHEGSGSGAVSPLGPLIPSGSILAGLAQRWREEQARAHPDSVWVRALGPPLYGLGGPLIAELRTASSHALLSPVIAEGHVLLRVKEDASPTPIRRWAIEEGTLVEAPDVAPPVFPLKVVTRGWGENAVLADAATGAQRWELTIPREGSASTGSFSPDGALCALVGCGDEYDFGFVHLFESATGRLLRKWEGPRPFWKAPVFSPDGQRLMVPSGVSTK